MRSMFDASICGRVCGMEPDWRTVISSEEPGEPGTSRRLIVV